MSLGGEKSVPMCMQGLDSSLMYTLISVVMREVNQRFRCNSP